jgi:enoyl-CoA hydratase/carnithine racemase
MDYQTILYEESDDKVATITINRPQSMNSFTGRMCEEFEHVWAQGIVNDNVNAFVLRASMDCKAFCTGVDVRGGRDVEGARAVTGPNPENPWFQVDPGAYLGPRANKMWKPVITAVHGMACGGAFYWLNESDFIICSEEATFFDPHVTYGMTAALEPIGATYRMPLGDVMRMALLGNDERIGSQSALRMGLVSEIVVRDALWDRAYELAAKVAAKPPAATQGTIRAVWESLDLPRTAALNMGMAYTYIGNPIGTAQVSRDTLMANKDKKFEIR